MEKIKFHPFLQFFFKTQLLLAVLIFLSFCAEQKKKERVPIEEKEKHQVRKKDRLTLNEAEAGNGNTDVFSLNEEEDAEEVKKKAALSKEDPTVFQKTNTNVSTDNVKKEDYTKPVISMIEITDNTVAGDTIRTTALVDTNPILIEDTQRTLKNQNPDIKDSTNNISVHLTDIDLDKNKTAEKKKMFVQLETRILFDGGTYELSSKYKERLNALIRDIDDEIQAYRAVNSNEELVLLIQVKGYADKKPFYEGQDEKERQKLNRELSSKRAEAVMQYLKKGVNQPDLEVEEIASGLGEELPLGVYDSPDLEDQNRRSCSIYLLICSQK